MTPAMLALMLAMLMPGPALASSLSACLAPGQWMDGEGKALGAEAALAEAARARVVILGERHATPAHHRWQAEMIRALAADGRPMVVGVEWFPRGQEAPLQALAEGRLAVDDFGAMSNWARHWGHDIAAYRPVLEQVAGSRVGFVPLNIDRSVVRATSREGLEAGLARARALGTPIGRPATPPPAYVERLAASFRAHAHATPSAEALERFVAAQTIWDRAMAEAIADALARQPAARVVALMGHGHVEAGEGVAHQLASLGHRAVFSAIPASAGEACPVAPHPGHRMVGTQKG